MRLSSDPSARRRLALLVCAAAGAFAAGVALGSGHGSDEHARQARAQAGREAPAQLLAAVDRLSLRQQVGQLTISTFPETAPPDYIRRRLRARETAGVILFARNGGPPAQWRGLTRTLQRSAGRSALVLVDQEGGPVRTVDWAGPAAAQPLQGEPASVRAGFAAAARQLRGVGVNVDLAPVADVATGAPSALASRSFAGDAAAVAASTRAAIAGMRDGRVAATAKHFPGLGQATANTDDASVTVSGPLADDLAPFRAALAQDVPLVMVSHALYPTIDGHRIASQSPRLVDGLLRRRLGFDGVVVTDSLEAQAVLDRTDVATAAERAVRAGVDLVLTTGSASWNEVHPRLLARARRSPDFRERVRRSAARVLALKRSLGLDLP